MKYRLEEDYKDNGKLRAKFEVLLKKDFWNFSRKVV